MAARIFMILAAVLLVAAVGIAALTPLGLTLSQGLLEFDRHSLTWLSGHSTAWIWTWIETPFLLRPLWLLPAGAGVVCAGIATSFNIRKPSPSRRRRS